MSKITYYDSQDTPVFTGTLTDEQATAVLNKLMETYPNGRVEMTGNHEAIVFNITQK